MGKPTSYSESLQFLNYTYRMVSRVFRIPFLGGVAPKKGIQNMSDIILYVFCITAAIAFVCFEFNTALIRLLMKSGMSL